jgi:zinc transporter 5/7
MFFDNAALALGLFASVMSTWPQDQVFTYGYSRVETLSGFANGLFLILISIFIVFEAIQRLMDPPEMNTNQLLTVSALGLAVNLVGLVATGGHHHHGHSHGVRLMSALQVIPDGEVDDSYSTTMEYALNRSFVT